MTPSANVNLTFTTCHANWLMISYNLHDTPQSVGSSIIPHFTGDRTES